MGRVARLACALLTALLASSALHAPQLAAQSVATQSAATQAAQSTTAPRFADQIEKLLAEDRRSPPKDGSILFIGSSIFRLWTTVAEQMAPLPAYNRAFGGSRTPEMLEQFDALVRPHTPRVIVYYCGSNDVAGGEPAAAVIDRIMQFVARVRETLPGTRVFFVSINKAPSRQKTWDVADAVNAAIKRQADALDELEYIDVNPVLFDADGRPRTELYLSDMLHFQPPAYVEFTRIIKPVLMRAWEAKDRRSPTPR